MLSNTHIMFFGKIFNLISKVKKLDRDKLMFKVMQVPILQAEIVDLNQKQLYDIGIDAKGAATGDYSSATVYGTVNFLGKIEKDQPYDHVTLKDSGASYKSMKVVNESDGFFITGEFPEAIDRGWPDALGLTQDSRNEIIPEIKERMIDEIKKDLLQ